VGAARRVETDESCSTAWQNIRGCQTKVKAFSALPIRRPQGRAPPDREVRPGRKVGPASVGDRYRIRAREVRTMCQWSTIFGSAVRSTGVRLGEVRRSGSVANSPILTTFVGLGLCRSRSTRRFPLASASERSSEAHEDATGVRMTYACARGVDSDKPEFGPPSFGMGSFGIGASTP